MFPQPHTYRLGMSSEEKEDQEQRKQAPSSPKTTTTTTMMMMNPLPHDADSPSRFPHSDSIKTHFNSQMSSPEDEQLGKIEHDDAFAGVVDPLAATSAVGYATAYAAAPAMMPESSSTTTTTKTKTSTDIDGVTSIDVLCGRDKTSHAHVGNKRFRQLIESHREVYQTASSRDDKTQITSQVIATVHSYGGRFMKVDDTSGHWEEVSEHYAKEKVSHALRSAKDPNRPRVKKRRQLKEYVPTPEEETLFQEVYTDQQRIFQDMVARHEGRSGAGGGRDDDQEDAAHHYHVGDNDLYDDEEDDPLEFDF